MRYIRHIVIYAFLAVTLPCIGQRIGDWTGYLSCYSVQHLTAAPNMVYAASGNAIFTYDLEDLTLETLSKGKGLSDVGIRRIGYDKTTKTLLVAYNNGNIDLLVSGRLYNVSGIKQWNYMGDKSINGIRFYKRKAYLACGFGLAVVDLDRHEVEDTYFFTTDEGTYLPIYDVEFVDTTIVVAMPDGLYKAPKEGRLLNVQSNWHRDTAAIWNAYHPTSLASFGGKLIMAAYNFDPSEVTLFSGTTALLSGDIRTLHASDKWLTVAMTDSVVVLDGNYAIQERVKEFEYGEMIANDALTTSDGTLWIAHDWAGLLVQRPDGSQFTTVPEGPASDNVYKLVSLPYGVGVCPGGKSSTNANLYIGGSVYAYQNQHWQNLSNPSRLYFYDVIDLAVDPYDAAHFSAAAWGAGIVDIHDNEVKTVYNDTNSSGALIPYSAGGFTALRTGAVTYDMEGNLWCTNSLVPNSLVQHKRSGEWEAYNTSSIVRGDEIYNKLYDSVNNYIFFSGRANRINAYNPTTGQLAYIDPNSGSKMETSSINAMVQDQNGHIWLATNKGIKVIYDAYKTFNNGGNGEQSPVTCSNILFTEGEQVEYLLAYENITSIAVDGANRKWVGTSAGGLYLLSSNGLEQLENFTTANSPLYSNRIVSVALHPITGEVFVGTSMGVQSYRSTATFATAQPEKPIHVFPNPVRPEYDGPVAFRGFTRNAVVHVTDEAGHVVYSTTAQGGQAIWYIRNHDGNRVSSGVYFVFASNEEGKMKSVAKVLVIK